MNFNKFKYHLSQIHQLFGLVFNVNYGLDKDDRANSEKEKDWVLGASKIKKDVLREDGQWDDFLPSEEKQSGRLFDSMACTRFGLLNVIEPYIKAKWGEDVNYSDRYISQGVGVRGSSMVSALENVRKYYGNVPESQWSTDWDKFTRAKYLEKPPTYIKEEGKKWIEKYNLQYENVPMNKKLLMEALKYGPLYVGGYAWYQSRGLYRSYGRANHCFMVYGYKEGEYWKAFDSYAPFKKKLAWDYQFGYVKQVIPMMKDEELSQINKLKAQGIKYIMRPLSHGEIYEIDGENIKYISKDDWNKLNVERTAKEKKLIGINEELFNKLSKYELHNK